MCERALFERVNGLFNAVRAAELEPKPRTYVGLFEIRHDNPRAVAS